ncbi:MAG: hypothetical protein LBV30_09400 [Propionibacteriaceae bacterium]|jgi:hypothetical protein|nr:hypothetical protein [Propionibacteriaceae bacterium]
MSVKHKVVPLFTALLMIVGLSVGASSAASAYSNTTTVRNGPAQIYLNGSAWWNTIGQFSLSDWWNGPKGAWNDPYAYVSGSTSQGQVTMARATMSMRIDGFVTSISSAPGFSISQGSHTCSRTYSSANGYSWVSAQQGGAACTARNNNWAGDYSITGDIRIGGAKWYSGSLNVY